MSDATTYPGQLGWLNRRSGEFRASIRGWESAQGVLSDDGPVWQAVWAQDALAACVDALAVQHMNDNELAQLRDENRALRRRAEHAEEDWQAAERQLDALRQSRADAAAEDA